MFRFLPSILIHHHQPCPIVARVITTSQPLYAEPLKKKKKLDIQLVRLRADRKVRKLEKEIRKLMKTPKQLKPIEEYQLPIAILKDLDTRVRPQTEEAESIKRNLDKLTKIWIAYKTTERGVEMRDVAKLVAAQEKALETLKLLSPELYKSALAIDSQFLPFKDEKILTETPRIDGYRAPDGVKTDVTKVWKM